MEPADEARDPSRRWLVVILALGLLIRLGWGLSRPVDDASIEALPDQRGYLEIARNLLGGEGLHYFDHRFGQTVYGVRMAGYPGFVAALGASVRAVRAAQAVLDTSTALAVYLLALRFTRGARAPLLACAFVAFNPFLVYFSALLLSETLYTTMLLWAMVSLAVPRGWRWAALGTCLLAVAVHVRPAGIGLPIVLAACAVGLRIRNVPPVRRRAFALRALVAGLVGYLVTFLVLVPWSYRNYRVLHEWLSGTTNDGITLYDGFNPGATGASNQSFLEQMPQVKDMSELERSDFFKSQAFAYIRQHPARAASLALAKIARTWSPVPLSTEFGRPLYRLVALLFAVPFDILVIAGILRGRLNRPTILFLLAPALYFTLIHALTVGSLRYRVPAEPALAVLAGVGAARLVDRRPKEERTAPS